MLEADRPTVPSSRLGPRPDDKATRQRWGGATHPPCPGPTMAPWWPHLPRRSGDHVARGALGWHGVRICDNPRGPPRPWLAISGPACLPRCLSLWAGGSSRRCGRVLGGTQGSLRDSSPRPAELLRHHASVRWPCARGPLAAPHADQPQLSRSTLLPHHPAGPCGRFPPLFRHTTGAAAQRLLTAGLSEGTNAARSPTGSLSWAAGPGARQGSGCRGPPACGRRRAAK